MFLTFLPEINLGDIYYKLKTNLGKSYDHKISIMRENGLQACDINFSCGTILTVSQISVFTDIMVARSN